MITLTEHEAILAGMACSFVGYLIGMTTLRVAHWLQSRGEEDRRAARSCQAYREHCNREHERALAPKVRPE